VAVFSDRATALVCRDNPASLEVVLAYGGRFIYAPGESAPLRGRHRFDLAVMSYDGDYAAARIPERADDFAQPLIALPPSDVFSQPQMSRLQSEPEGAAVLTAAYPEGHALILRLWRPYPGDAAVQLTVPGASSLARADLQGRAVETLAEGPTAKIPLRSQGIVTVRAEGIR
jgi:alpha-mannosidase